MELDIFFLIGQSFLINLFLCGAVPTSLLFNLQVNFRNKEAQNSKCHVAVPSIPITLGAELKFKNKNYRKTEKREKIGKSAVLKDKIRFSGILFTLKLTTE